MDSARLCFALLALLKNSNQTDMEPPTKISRTSSPSLSSSIQEFYFSDEFEDTAADEFLDLPLEIMAEILSHASLETLGRCRLVSKELKQITYDPSFAKIFFERTKTVSGFFVQTISGKVSTTFVSMENPNDDDDSEILSLNFLPEYPIKVLATTKYGILLCGNNHYRNHNMSQYYVCKPTTKQWKEIPSPETSRRPIFAMTVLRCRPLRFKIVRFSSTNYCTFPFEYQYEIFDSETWKWKQILNDLIRLPYDALFYLIKPAVRACGISFWLLKIDQVFGFNLEDESWEIFALPWPLCEEDYFQTIKLVEYEGRLALLCMVPAMEGRHCLELWVRHEGCKKIWSKRHEVCMEELVQKEGSVYPLALFNSDVVVLVNANFDLIFFKFHDCSFNFVTLEEQFYCTNELFPFQSDLEPWLIKKGI